MAPGYPRTTEIAATERVGLSVLPNEIRVIDHSIGQAKTQSTWSVASVNQAADEHRLVVVAHGHSVLDEIDRLFVIHGPAYFPIFTSAQMRYQNAASPVASLPIQLGSPKAQLDSCQPKIPFFLPLLPAQALPIDPTLST
jgi:hypothetical protein